MDCDKSSNTPPAPSLPIILRVQGRALKQFASNAAATSTKSTTSGEVFGTFELLHAILVHLPLRDVFVLQRVNKTFHNVVHRSPDILKALHLVPDQNARPRIIFTLFYRIKPPIFEATHLISNPCVWYSPLSAAEQGFESSRKETRIYLCVTRWTRREDIASWGDMFPVQPPLKVMEVRIMPPTSDFLEIRFANWRGKVLRCDSGITLRMMMETANKLFGRFGDRQAVHFRGVLI